MEVEAEISEVDLSGGDGYSIASVRAHCGRCGYETESYGRHQGSINRCLALLREGCPWAERNYYVTSFEPPPPKRGETRGTNRKARKAAPKPQPQEEDGDIVLRLRRPNEKVYIEEDEKDGVCYLVVHVADDGGTEAMLYLDVYDVTDLLLGLKRSAIKSRR